MRRLVAPGHRLGAGSVLRRSVLAVVVGALVGSLVVAGAPWQALVAAPPVIDVAVDEASASVAAVRQGRRVEVVGLRSASSSTFANPDGTWTLEQSVGPVRVRRGDGWVPTDATLARTRARTFAARATTVAVEVSGGGRAPLVRVSDGAREFALTWPSPLPEPVVDGAVATYVDVLPGVDLKVRATDQGFGHEVVVKTPAAVESVARVRFGLSAIGVRVVADSAGNLSAVDGGGAVVFQAPAPLMWDAGSKVERPVGVEVGRDSVTLVPDLAVLRDPGTRFPVVIDPTFSYYTPNARNSWTLVRRSHPGSKHWNLQPRDEDERLAGVARVGHAPGWPSAYLDRSLFAFDTQRLAGVTIESATFRIWQVWKDAHSCNPVDVDPVELWHTGGIGPSTDWDHQPAWLTKLDEVRSVPKAGYCDPDWVGMNAKAAVDLAALNGSPGVVLGLRANDESGDSGWKRFYVQNGTYPMLSITYNQRPTVTGVGVEPGLTACVWCGGVPWVGNSTLNLVGTVNDGDGGQVTGTFRIRKPGQITVSQNRTAGHKAATPLVVNTSIPDGTTVTWDFAGSDGALGVGPVNGPSFKVDNTTPAAAPSVVAALYEDDNRWHGGVGVSDTFTFDSTDADVDHYVYGWQDPPVTKAVPTSGLGGSASVELAPPGDGPQTLYVRAVDRAGNLGPVTDYRIYVRAGNGAYTQYSFEGNTQDTAFLGDRHGTLTGTGSYAPGPVGNAIVFDGGVVTAPRAVATDSGFTVSAWVRLEDPTGDHTAVSQTGGQVSGFQLGYRAANGGRWVFALPPSDSTSVTSDAVSSAVPANPDTVTHLAGVYDAKADQIRLYVNGEPAGTAPHLTSWDASGQLRLGSGWRSGAAELFWPGLLDEVELFDHALPEAEVRAMVTRNNVQVAHWKFDEAVELPDPGTTARNAVEGGDMAVLLDDAQFVENENTHTGGSVLFGGAGAVTTHGPVVRTDQSFSVAAWVKLADTDPVDRAAVCQDGERISGFCLGHDSTGSWTFGMPNTDTDTPAVPAARSDDEVSDNWTHLVGVHDAATDQILLYVDGTLEETVSYTSSWSATGPFRIGQALVAGQLERGWEGLIDEVRVYSRVIGANEVAGIVAQDDVAAAHWELDGDGTDSAGDRNGTVTGDPAWTAGQSANPAPGDQALLLTGASTQYVQADSAVATDRAFTVSAWVRVDQPGQQGAVVSQDGNRVSGFTLRSTTTGQWSFAMPVTDTNNATLHHATGGAVQVGAWTHLAGVYSTFPVGTQTQGRLELYVNGTSVATAAHNPVAFTDGNLQIGRAKHNGASGQYFTGAIDDVTVYTRPLLASQVLTMSGRDLSLVHHWRLDEPSGTNAADSVGARGAILTGAASFNQGRVGNSIAFDNGVASTTGIDTRTDESFTVAAWVRLDSTATASTAVSVDGTHISKFKLGYRRPLPGYPYGQWTFEMSTEDTIGTPEVRAAVSRTQLQVGKWVHLVGVYDQPSGLIRLYVEKAQQDDSVLPQAWNSTGPLRIGRGQADDQPAEYWPGEVDDVRLYTGALDRDRVTSLRESFPAEQTPPTLPEANLGGWAFDERTGTVTADDSGQGRPATVYSGTGTSADWAAGRRGGAAWLNGASYAQTAGPVVADGQSFSATSWVYLTTGLGPGKVVLGQDGEHVSSFQLGYDTTAKRWSVVVPEADTPNPPTKVLTSIESGWLGEWTHLGVVYDASGLGELRLYVNGVLVGHRAGVKVPSSDGPFTIGRGKWNGAHMGFFPRGIDDVRVFSRALSDGEVRLVHDSAGWATLGSWRFDAGSGRDYTGRTNASLAQPGVTFTPGVSGVALQLDGVNGAGATSLRGPSMRDSFTVSAWARLAHGGQVATVLGQDGSRVSGFVVQYRPELGRWVFGSRVSDSDGAALSYAASAQPAVLNRWTHLTGVYDRAAQQLRLYVDGQLAGTRNHLPLWAATGGFTMGRGKVNGARAEFFPGAIDEVRADLGMVSDTEIARRASWPAPVAGMLGVFVNAAGDRYTAPTAEPVRAGYRFERALGTPVAAGQDGIHLLYSCRSGTDLFTSTDPACEGQVLLGEVGWVYSAPPTGVQTVPLVRCARTGDRFDAVDCGTATEEDELGYTVAYASLARYRGPYGDDHTTLLDGVTPGHLLDGAQGWVPLVAVPGTQPLFGCREDTDSFVSVDPLCEGKQVVTGIGHVYPVAPPELLTYPLYRCRSPVGYDGAEQRFTSLSETCEGQTVDSLLGHVLTAPPVPDHH